MKNIIKYTLCLFLIRMQVAQAAPAQPQISPPVVTAAAVKPSPTVAPIAAAATTVAPIKPVVTPAATQNTDYPEILSTKSFLQAKKMIEYARQRYDLNFTTPADEVLFEQLIQSYVTVHWIDNGAEFTTWWKQNKQQMIQFAPAMGRNINWETFLTNIMLAYYAQKKTPAEYSNWMQSVLANPVTAAVSHTTAYIVTAGFFFLTGIIYNSVVNGPVVGTVNQWLKSIVEPFQQKAAVNGVKTFGELGKRANGYLFKPKITTLAERLEELKRIENTIYDGRQFTVSAEQLSQNMEEMSKLWNDINHKYNQIPEAYRTGRSLMSDVAIFRPADFALRLTNTMSAAEVSRESAWSEIGRIQQRTGQYEVLENDGVELNDLLGQQNVAERSGDEVSSKAIQIRIMAIRAQIEAMGASARQTGMIVENLRMTWIYRQQSAGIIASKMFHDFNYSDVTMEVQRVFSGLQDNYATKYFTAQLASEVQQISAQIRLKLDLQIKALEEVDLAATTGKRSALSVVRGLNKSAEGQRALAEPSNLQSAKKESIVESIHEGAVEATRR